MILDKALTLELANFEDAEYYDKLVRARRLYVRQLVAES